MLLSEKTSYSVNGATESIKAYSHIQSSILTFIDTDCCGENCHTA